jgi:beta-glucanase (GH16 family)
VSLAYWSEGFNTNGKIIRVETGKRLHDDWHTYTVFWTPTFLSLSLDGKQIANATAAAANTTIPFLPGSVLLINRVDTVTYEGDSVLALSSASYTPLSSQQ